MEYFKNKSESFFREIRNIEIHKASDISYINNFNGAFPDSQAAVCIFEVVPESFSRKIATKTANGNYFTEIDISFPLLDLSKDTIDKCYEVFNKKNFAVVLVSNTEKLMLGNDREKMKVEFIDNKKDDNSGNDECILTISGDTIVKPQTQEI